MASTLRTTLPRPASAARRPWRRSRATEPLLGLTGIACLVVVLQIVPSLGLVDETQFPPFSTMISALGDQLSTPAFWSGLGSTLRGWAIGLAASMVAGLALGFVIGGVKLLREATGSTIEFLRPIPSVALVPLAVLLFGTSMRSTLLLVIYGAFFQVLIQVLYGTQDVDPVARDTARSYRLSRWTQLRVVTWPTALPYVLTGFRLAATVGLVLEVTGELVIGSPGIGSSIAVARSAGQIPPIYALIIVTGLLGVAVNVAARMIERRLLRWHPSVREEALT